MRKVLLAAALTVSMALTACGNRASPTYSNSAGSLALSRDDSLVYAVDTDNEILAVVDAASQEKVAEVKLGRAPETIVVAPDDTLYITNRGSRSVSVIHRGVWEEAARIPVGVEPVGLAVSPDGKTLYVVNSTSLESAEYGTLTAIDTASKQVKWDLAIGEEPRSIALVEDGTKALVTLFKSGDVVKVDLKKAEVIQDNTKVSLANGAQGAVYFKANEARLTGQNGGFGAFSSFRSRAASSIAASPDGQHAYMTVTWAREDNISQLPNSGGGYYSAGGPCNLGAVASAGLVTYTAVDAEPQVDDLTACASSGQNESKPYPSTILSRKDNDQSQPPVQGSTVAVVDPTGSWLFIVSREGKNVVVSPTARRTGDDINFGLAGTTVRDQVKVGNGANGIAIAQDGKTLYVYNQFDHTISVIREHVTRDGFSTVTAANTIKVANDLPDTVMPVEAQIGRIAFFDATDPHLNNAQQTGVSCNTCHTEGGREDGHVWGFPDGKRQTPALSGRMMGSTAPYHWSGEFSTINEFMDHTATLRMGGTGLDNTKLNQLVAYMDYVPAPENPYKLAQPSEAQIRGAQIFQQAECSTCHGGEAYTLNTMANVGTINSDDKINVSEFDRQGDPMTALNTPSLLGLARSAPYLHDGSAATLKDRIRSGGDVHGKTSQLTDAQIDDLVAYLKSL